ncbi:MAG: sugar phosphate isomerase/epimerase [Planctomycetaceae bacterium]|nr:sugar phosphate isomerase/epimerase [Planctomycetaceae bacterium]
MKAWGILAVSAMFALSSIGCRAEQANARAKWGICTSVDNGQKLKDAGYDYIEAGVQKFLVTQSDEAEFQKNLAAAKAGPLPVYACNSFIPAELKCVGPEANPAGVVAYAGTAFARAKQAGVKRIVFGSGKSRAIPEGFDRAKARQQFVDILRQMGPLAGENDVVVIIEPLNTKETNFINSVAEGAEIAKEANHPNICVLADFYHMALENESPDSIRQAGPMLKHCHIAEKENRLAPGTTAYDFTPYFKALKDIGYNGGISIEGRWNDFDAQLAGALKTMQTQWDAAK